MSRSSAGVVLVAGAVALGGLLLVATPAAADPPDAVGWWTRRPGAQPLGNGGFELAAGLQGEESIAAVRVGALPDGTSQARLVVTEAPGGDPETEFRACRAASQWEPADGGAWDLRAVADCTTAVDAVRVGSGRWAVELGPFLGGDAPVEVVLVPIAAATIPGLGPPVGFTTAFTGVDVVLPTQPAAASGPRPSTPRPPSPSPTPSSVAPSPVVSVPGPAPVAVGPAATPAPTATTPAGESAPGNPAAIEAPMFEPTSGGGDDRPWGRLLLLVPLSAVVGATATAGRNLARDGSLSSALRVVQPWRRRTGTAEP